MSLITLTLLLGLLPHASVVREFPVQESETIQKSFPFDGSALPEIEVDNVSGSIQVVGYEGRSAELVLRETRRGRSSERLEAARQDVRILITQTGNRVRLYVDGPFRCGGGGIRYQGPEHDGYAVEVDFSLRVPRETALVLKTVNDGEIRVDGVTGTFDLTNVNGGIDLTGAAGAGRAYAVNGGVNVVYRKNPQGDSYFGSLNGDVSVVLGADLSARLLVKTFNGDVYTDYPVSYLRELPPMTFEKRQGRKVYKASGFYGLQVGAGGPALKFDAFNGDIRILRRGSQGEAR